MKNSHRGFIASLLIIIATIVIIGGIYFYSTKQATITDYPILSTHAFDNTVSTSTNNFRGVLKGTKSAWTLTFDKGNKEVDLYSLQFTNNSVCVIGPDTGQCSILQSNFYKGNTVSTGGGDTVNISGTKREEAITVEKLVVEENFASYGTIVPGPENNKPTWHFIYQPTIGSLTAQDPNRQSTNVPLIFDENSFCGGNGVYPTKCDFSQFRDKEQVFLSGLQYKGSLMVRLLTIINEATPAVNPK